MKFYFKQFDDIKVAKGMVPDVIEKSKFSKVVKHQGHSYSLHEVYSRQLTKKEKAYIFLECLGKTVLTFGIMLIFKNFRDKWDSVFKKTHVIAVYLPAEPNEKTPISQIAKIQKSSLPIASPTKDIPLSSDRNILSETTDVEESKTLHKAEDSIELSNTDSLANIQNQEIQKETISLSNIFKHRREEGFDIDSLNLEDKNLLQDLAQKWKSRPNPEHENWTLKELSSLLDVKIEDLEELCYRVQIFHNPNLPIHSKVLSWLFDSINKKIDHKPSTSMQWGIQGLWNGQTILENGQENRFPQCKYKTWNIAELSMFLAIEEKALENFLKAKLDDMYLSPKGEYNSHQINQVFKTIASNEEINLLENKHRTQQKSIRWMA